MSSSAPPGYIWLEDFARIWRVDPDLVHRVCERGELTCFRTNDGRWAISHVHISGSRKAIERSSQDVQEVETSLGEVQQVIRGTATVSDFHGQAGTVAGVLFQIADDPAVTRYIHYLTELINRLFSISLDYIDHEALVSRVSLARVYVPPLVYSSEPDDLEVSSPDHIRIPQYAVSSAARHRRLVLTGAPGSGKSTVARYIALCLAGEEMKRIQGSKSPIFQFPSLADLEGWPQNRALCPVYLELARFAYWLQGFEGTEWSEPLILRFIRSELEKRSIEFTSDLLRRLLDGNCFLVFDGLDEVPDTNRLRTTVTDAILSFSSKFRECSIMVTCRSYAYDHSVWYAGGFHPVTLAPFNTQQIDDFLDQWFSYMAEENPSVAKNVPGCVEALKREIHSRPDDIGHLAERPLLLTFLASLRTREQVALPSRRAPLYEKILRLLVQNWERNKVILRNDGSIALVPCRFIEGQLSVEDIRRALDKVAFEVHESQQDLREEADIPGWLIAKRLNEVISVKSSAAGLSEVEIVRDISRRIGVLVCYSEGEIEGAFRFPHHTFQEYMAACHLCSDEVAFPETLIDLVKNEPSKWWEVALFAIDNLAKPNSAREAWQVIEDLCCDDQSVSSAKSNSLHWQLCFLAGQAVRQSELHKRQLGHQGKRIIQIVRNRVAALVKAGALQPLERAECGRILAELDDPREGIGTDASGQPDIAWIPIPDGHFFMGSDPRFTMGTGKERPYHREHVPLFRISKYPITNQQYQAFVNNGGYEHKEFWSRLGWIWKEQNGREGPANSFDSVFLLNNHPRVGVTWYEAIAFCNWLSKELSCSVRLPTEAEWEKAARGTARRNFFPWGEEEVIVPELCNMEKTGIGTTCAVGLFPKGASPYGCMDMSGNVIEWCSTQWREDYSIPANEKVESDEAVFRVARGGAYNYREEWRLHTGYRRKLAPDFWSSFCGFRIATSDEAC
jgi:formylglycine-generating enzyme required for sulfatase activity